MGITINSLTVGLDERDLDVDQRQAVRTAIDHLAEVCKLLDGLKPR
ncbi:hypothetical protein [Actinoallomurus iriomotensis]|uniref:Uncharacterized protein n=1 Tax=Actinoallomurus iriomotensis TaxID=478107 RepID=A0A9W6S171_9ACTN|nr:hypothetical protein [Actinoallomurus iriomotensis]GLY83545.1 hypothetical protein Airi02_014750 [Actinoallomurus iriomotensis]